MQNEYSDVQLFVRPIGPDVTHEEVEEYFTQAGELKELRLMPGYAFIEFETAESAQRAFTEFLNKPFAGEPLQIEYAKHKPEYAKKGENRVKVSNLPEGTAWQDFKDFIREEVRLTPTFVRIPHDEPTVCHLEFGSKEDLESAISQLNGVNFRDVELSAEEDTSPYIASASRSFNFKQRGFRGRGRGRGSFRGGYQPRGGYAPRGGFDGGYRPYQPRGGFEQGGYRPPRDNYGPPMDGPRGGYIPREGGYPPRDYAPRESYPPREGFVPRGGRGGYAPREYRDGPSGGAPPPLREYRDGPSGGAPPPRDYRSSRDGPEGSYSGDREYSRDRSPSRY
ncbi:hypothetical protein CANARDRAFT_85459 [[Candida] arabinofermentans NRRL YB-2248]|uniref:RRM domain-containing protein n=1 Tax=[Candida] arabinofermentans NRRL YB-2248 TaxID=983967 RepID=A0A1E4T601_9ASCO|nr:hypothetical protein CANARDRAFT_85459 [[Candida] arabinofermentans NRRL YB-2248]